MKDCALVVMAAGMGSRYGGVKQLEAVGPHGELIMDYSVRYSISAGFTKIVFVLREEIEADFWEKIGNRIKEQYVAKGIEITSVLQCVEDLPTQYTCPSERDKPWGTGHALFSCRNIINCPFAIINADDYYGKSSFNAIYQFLQGLSEKSERQYCMTGFKLGKTLSSCAGVTRGVCIVDKDDYVQRVIETREICRTIGGTIMSDSCVLDQNTVVSMNMWGYTLDVFEIINERFCRFLEKHINSLSAEFLLPDFMDELIREKAVSVRQLPTDEEWYGITHKEDIAGIRESLQRIVNDH